MFRRQGTNVKLKELEKQIPKTGPKAEDLRQWVSKTTSRKAVANIVSQIEHAGYKILRHHVGDWGMLHISVDYDPALPHPNRVKIKPQWYIHRGRRTKIWWACVDWCWKSVDKYLQTHIPDPSRHLQLDLNPGMPLYNRPPEKIHPVSRTGITKKGIYIYCFDTPRKLVEKALKMVKEHRWPKWHLFACAQSYGIGGYIIAKDAT
jgi:hypothetical protein